MKMSLTNVNNGDNDDNDGEPVMKTTVLDSDRHHKTRHKHHIGCPKVVDADLCKYKIQDKEIQKYSILLMRDFTSLVPKTPARGRSTSGRSDVIARGRHSEIQNTAITRMVHPHLHGEW